MSMKKPPDLKFFAEFYRALFGSRDALVLDTKYKLQRVKGLRAFRVGRYLIIEQNPEKETTWAERAKRGEKIAWVIDTAKNKYIYRIEKDKLIRVY